MLGYLGCDPRVPGKKRRSTVKISHRASRRTNAVSAEEQFDPGAQRQEVRLLRLECCQRSFRLGSQLPVAAQRSLVALDFNEPAIGNRAGRAIELQQEPL